MGRKIVRMVETAELSEAVKSSLLNYSALFIAGIPIAGG